MNKRPLPHATLRTVIEYRGCDIRRGIDGNFYIWKGGHYIASAPSEEKAREAIDLIS